MSSRTFQAIVVTLGAGAMMTAYFTQGATPPPASTLQAGTHHRTTGPKPLQFDLIAPITAPTPDPQDTTELRDYNPCGFIPLSEVHAITGERLLFQDAEDAVSLTADLAKARVSTRIVHEQDDQFICILAGEPSFVKANLLVGIVPSMPKPVFDTYFRLENRDSNPNSWAERVSTAGLPGADSAYVTYGSFKDKRSYQELLVHTKTGQVLEIKPARFDQREIRDLAKAALSTLDGSRYGYNK